MKANFVSKLSIPAITATVVIIWKLGFRQSHDLKWCESSQTQTRVTPPQVTRPQLDSMKESRAGKAIQGA